MVLIDPVVSPSTGLCRKEDGTLGLGLQLAGRGPLGSSRVYVPLCVPRQADCFALASVLKRNNPDVSSHLLASPLPSVVLIGPKLILRGTSNTPDLGEGSETFPGRTELH